MSKRIVAVFVVAVLVAAMVPAKMGGKADAADTTKVKQVIDALGIMNTDDKSSNNKVTRAQFSQMMVNMSSNRNKVSKTVKVSLFKDVSKKYWAAPYIQIAVKEQWMTAYLNGSFKPNNSITLQEAVNAVVKILGYSDSDFTGNKNGAKLSLYYSKGLDKNINKAKGQVLSKEDCIHLFYNTLIATTKEGVVYATVLGYAIDANGDVDYLSVVNKEMEGPIIAGLNWETQLPFSLDKATYYRNSVSVSKDFIELYDVLYYNKNMKKVWAYSDKISGTVEQILPDKLSPNSIIIAGNTLTLGTQDIAYQFSTMGSVKEGQIVTVLLGKDGTVAGVLTEDQYNATINGSIVDIGKRLTNLKASDAKLCDYVTVVDSAGRLYTVEFINIANIKYLKGTIVKITFSNGKAEVAYNYQRFQDPIQGTVNNLGTAMGNYKLSDDIKIIDVQGSQYKSIYASRLDGIQLFASDILYYNLNKNNEIDKMILKNVTGDIDSFGILKSIDYIDKGFGVDIVYTYTVGTETKVYTSSDYNTLLVGPVKISYDGVEVKEFSSLMSASVSEIKGMKLNTSYGTLTLSDNVAVYYLEDSTYNMTKLNKVSDLKKYTLTAYYDKTAIRGGRVRVIIARANNR